MPTLTSSHPASLHILASSHPASSHILASLRPASPDIITSYQTSHPHILPALRSSDPSNPHIFTSWKPEILASSHSLILPAILTSSPLNIWPALTSSHPEAKNTLPGRAWGVFTFRPFCGAWTILRWGYISLSRGLTLNQLEGMATHKCHSLYNKVKGTNV